MSDHKRSGASSSSSSRHHSKRDKGGDPFVLLDGLFSTIQDSYNTEFELESKVKDDQDASDAISRSIKDLMNDAKISGNKNNKVGKDQNSTCTSADSSAVSYGIIVTKLEVIVSWKKLVEALYEHSVFLDYVHIMSSTFNDLLTFSHTPSIHLTSEGTQRTSNTKFLRIQKNLVDLLEHTVVHHSKDACTECRFVTLLEVARSYGSNWKPSRELHRFWMRLMQKISHNISPVDFRRGAYGVLVSLSWVPSSKGLLEACSISDHRWSSGGDGIGIGPGGAGGCHNNVPVYVRELLEKIRNTPLPRNDSVYQVLDRIKDEMNVNIAISNSLSSGSNERGMGKTTLAALVVTHPIILQSFTVLWLPMNQVGQGQSPMSYAQYLKLLEMLCEQLNQPNADNSVPPLLISNSDDYYAMYRLEEEPSIREMREKDEMRRMKHFMAHLLRKEETNHNEKFLIVLDDVGPDGSIVEWFQFVENQSLLVTTRHAHQIEPFMDWVIDQDVWSEDEAIELFLSEADFQKSHVMASADEVRWIVRKCKNHPLTVRTVARWFKLKDVTAGAADGLIESNKELSSSKVLSEVLIRALTPLVKLKSGKRHSILFMLCMLSMAAVFSDFGGQGDWRGSGGSGAVPLDSVLLLWEQLIKMEPDAADEIGENLTAPVLKRRVWIFVEGLTHLGLIVITERDGNPFVEMYHPMYVEFALNHVLKFDNNEETAGSTVNEGGTVMLWNKAFVTCYLSKKAESSIDNCLEYAMEKLVKHMIRGRMFQKAETLLSDGLLYKARIMALGYKKGTELHTEDCTQLRDEMNKYKQYKKQQLLHKNANSSTNSDNDNNDDDTNLSSESVLIAVTRSMVDYLQEEVTHHQTKNTNISPKKDKHDNKISDEYDYKATIVEISKALYSIGFFLADNRIYNEAIMHYKAAQKLLPRGNAFHGTILYGLCSVYIITNDYDKAIKRLAAGLKHSNAETSDKSVMYRGILRLYGEALFAGCRYREAKKHFDSILRKQFRMHSINNDESTKHHRKHKDNNHHHNNSESSNNSRYNSTESSNHQDYHRIDYGMILALKGRLELVMGEDEKALSTMADCIQWKQTIKEKSRSLAQVYSILGDIYAKSTGHVKEAVNQYEKALNILQALCGGGDGDMSASTASASSRRGRSRNNHQQQQHQNDKTPAAVQSSSMFSSFEVDIQLLKGKIRYLVSGISVNWTYFELARNEILKQPIALMDQSPYDLRCMAHAYISAGDYETAMALLDDATRLLAARRKDSLERSMCLLEMGNCLLDQGEHMNALCCFENSVEIQILKLGECEQVLETLNLVGNVHASIGSHAEALRIYEKVLELTYKLCQDDNEKIASALYALGEAHEGLRQYSDAETIFVDCLEVIKQDRRPDHPDIAKTLQRLGSVTSWLGDIDRSYQYYDDALQIREANFGPQHAAMAETMHGLGVVLRKRCEYEKSHEYLMHALDIRKKNEKRQTCTVQDVCETLLEIGHLHVAWSFPKKNYNEGFECYLECIHRLERVNRSDPMLCKILLAIGNAKISIGQDEDALKYCERAFALSSQLFGEDHALTIKACRSVGIVKWLMNSDGAVRCLHDYVKVMDERNTCDNIEYVIAMQMLGDTHAASGYDELAKQAYLFAKEICTNNPNDVAKQYPEIVDMIDQRLVGGGPALSSPHHEKGSSTGNSRNSGLSSAQTSSPSSGNTIFARLQENFRLGEEEVSSGVAGSSSSAQRAGEVYHSPKEVAILRKMILVDE